MTTRMLGLVLAGGILAGTLDARAQSLAEVARKEAERRGTVTTPGKTYTNANLTPDFTKPDPPPAAAPAPASPREAAAAGDAGKVDEAAGEAEEAAKWGVTPRDQQEPGPADDVKEDFWRERAALIKSRLAAQNAQVDQLRARMAATQGSPDAERDVLERTFSKATADLKHINDEWVRFERQARDRGVPEHWIK